MGALLYSGDDADQIVSRNPATGAVLERVPLTGAEAVRAAVQRARQAQVEWGALPVRDRATRVQGLRDVYAKEAERICDLLSREVGKPRMEALTAEVSVLIDTATYFSKRAPEILAPHQIPLHLLKTHKSYIHYAPRGVVGIIAPWNFPIAIPGCEAVMAMLAGNAVVLKPSEVTPLTALLLKELHDRSGLPPELFQVVTGRGDTGAALIDAGIDYCIFTGSTATGRKVAAACGERLIPCVLELGGKTPAIVCADADVPRTARALCWGAFTNSGQACVSVERVYAHEAVYDELLRCLRAEAEALRQGDPQQAEVDLGSMAWDRQWQITKERVDRAQQEGAQVLCGGLKEPGAEGLFFPPTILSDCRHDMEVMRREIFGPVMPVMKVGSEEEAVRLSNDSPLGLMAYVFTRDKKKGRRMAERLEAGTVMVNDVGLTFGAPETPWAGLKESGIGRTHSEEGLRDLCQTRHVNEDRVALQRELWWYPYSDRLYQRALSGLRWLFR